MFVILLVLLIYSDNDVHLSVYRCIMDDKYEGRSMFQYYLELITFYIRINGYAYVYLRVSYIIG